MLAGHSAEAAAALARDVAANAADAALAPTDRALLEYALKLTRDPGRMVAADVERLRSAGLGDRAIHDACAITAYFAFVNRIADGLGVELEPGGHG
jgi:uncharacterized peroxidase-related enzyme